MCCTVYEEFMRAEQYPCTAGLHNVISYPMLSRVRSCSPAAQLRRLCTGMTTASGTHMECQQPGSPAARAGSMNMSYDSSNLTTPDIKWLGVRPSDLDRFNIPEQCRLPMTDEDIKTGKRLVRRRCRQQAHSRF